MQQGYSYDISEVMTEANATGLFVSLFTAQMPSGNLGPSGAPDGLFNPVSGLTNIPCTAPPVSDSRIEATEVKDLAEILSVKLKHVLLNGYYGTLDDASNKGWNCLLDGVAYDILGVEHDSQRIMTRVSVRIAGI